MTNIIDLLNQHKDEIMKCTIGSFDDQDNEVNADSYSFEWSEFVRDVSDLIETLKTNGVDLDASNLVGVILSYWYGVMTFSEGDLDLLAMNKICTTIMQELH